MVCRFLWGHGMIFLDSLWVCFELGTPDGRAQIFSGRTISTSSTLLVVSASYTELHFGCCFVQPGRVPWEAPQNRYPGQPELLA